MTQSARSSIPTGRRCQNCGSRVAQNAETCYFCGHELTGITRKKRGVTWREAALALALLAVVILWWQFGRRGQLTQPPTEAQAETHSSPAETADAPLPTTGAEGPQPGRFATRHLVKEGETLIEIVAKYGVTVEDVQAANGLTGTLIRTGEELLIPIPASISESGNGNGPETVSTVFNYTVRTGDTLVSIAVRFGANVAALQEANGIGGGDLIRPEQVLKVPVAGVPLTVLAAASLAASQQGSDAGQQYGRLQLLGPDEGATIPRAEDVTFRWLSVGLLQPNEWYVLFAWPREGLFELPPPVWTQASSFRLTNRWAPPPDQDVAYRWQLSVVRVLMNAEGELSIEEASVPSEVRSFIWSGRGN